MNDITRDRILKNVYSKINELIEFFQTNGSSDAEIEKRINSSMNGLVSSIKYGDVPFSLDRNEETKIKKKEPDKPKEEKLDVKEEKEEKNEDKIVLVEIKDEKPKRRSRTLKTK